MISKNFIELVDIESIESIGEQNVVDISIADHNSFMLANGLMVHNSAKSSCIAGFSAVGRDYYGAFPLKGKILNVREQPTAKVKENAEISNICTILGLVPGLHYPNKEGLRYGKVVFMTDADVDGTHIKGLLLNLFHTYWPELLENDFVYEFITPIVRARKGGKTGLVKDFYNLSEFKEWQTLPESTGWTVKYYKGLGTILPDEIKEMFKNVDNHLIPFKWSGTSGEKLDMAFSKKRAEDRKGWLENYQGEIQPDKLGKPTIVDEFIDLELVQFSMSDNARSIPSVYDGLKPSQRKVLYTVLKRNIQDDIKVSQLAGSVAELSAYHHGEQNLIGTIVGMAQDYVGSNNINLLAPEGQFGTRIQGGSDYASGRYIYTKLMPWTKSIYKTDDNNQLEWLMDDGLQVEPKYYVPVIPMILVNGTEGIGTGWSTEVPKYNPKDLIKWLRNKIQNKKNQLLIPYYKGFTGTIVKSGDNWMSRGIIEKESATKIRVKELPISMWTEKYTIFLDKLQEDKFIRDWTNYSTEQSIDILVSFSRETLANITEEELVTKLGLETTIRLSNMHLFNGEKIQKFDTPEDIINTYYPERLKVYEGRRNWLIAEAKEASIKAKGRMDFIKYVLKGELIVSARSTSDVEVDMEKLKIPRMEGSYEYCLGMPMRTMTKEKAKELADKAKELAIKVKELSELTPESMWLTDLDELEKSL